MKTIKYSILTLISVVISVCLVSCSEDYSSPLKGKTVNDVVFETGIHSKTVSIGTEDLTKCTVASSANWCRPTIEGSSVSIFVQNNDTYEERKAIVTLTDPEDATTLSFNVIQNQNDAIIVDGKTFEIPEEGGEVSIKVKSNLNYVVEIPANATWLTKSTSSTRGLSDSTVKLKADKNNSGDEREAIVKLTDSKSGTTSEFTVKQSLTPVIKLSIESFEIDEMGGEFEVTVNSNIDLNIDIDDYWVSLGEKKEADGFSFIQKFVVSPIPEDGSSRSTFVSFVPKNNKWEIYKNLKISQSKSLSIKDKSVKIWAGESYTLNVVNNTGKSLTWKSSNTSVATVNSSGKVTGVSNGNATITVTTTDGKFSDQTTITVKDIRQYITGFCNTGMSIGQGVKYSIGCYIENGSDQNIELTKCTVYKNGNYVDSMSFSKTLQPGQFEGVKLESYSNITAYPYKFVWEYVFKGNTYTLDCNYQP